MKVNLAKTLLGAAALACGTTGCCAYRNWVDVSYPERYEYEAREIVAGAISAQVENGHVLDQTVWNAYFDPGTDRLTPAGIRDLQYLARRRPAPDTVLYLQTATDLLIDPDHPEAMVEPRMKLDIARQKAVQRMMLAMTGSEWMVVLNNPAVPSLSGSEGVSINQDIIHSGRGTMGAGAAAGGPAGGAPAGGAPGGGH